MKSLINIVYGLKDPRNDVYCYIGKSSVGISRPLNHLTNSHSNSVNEWINSLKSDGFFPKIEIIEEVEDVSMLGSREKYWIIYYNNINPNLLNRIKFDSYYGKELLNEASINDDNINYMAYIFENIHSIIKKERLSRGLSQEELSSEAGISRSTLSMIECGDPTTMDSVLKCINSLKSHLINKSAIRSKASRVAHT